MRSQWKFSVNKEVKASKAIGVRPSLLRKIIKLYGGEDEMEFTSTYDVYKDVVEPVVGTSSSTKEASKKFLSYCHYVREQDEDDMEVGISSVYVSHAFHLTDFLSLVRAIEYHYERANQGNNLNIYYWIDIFSHNCSYQLPINVKEQLIESCSHFVVVASPVVDIPAPLTRLWCLFELYIAITSSRNINVAMTREDENALLEDLWQNGHSERYRIMCDSLQISTASVSNTSNNISEQETAQIDDALRQCILQRSHGISNEQLNKLLQRQMLQSWIADTIVRRISGKDYDKFSDPRQVRYIEALACVKRDLGLRDDAISLYKHILKVHAKVYRGENNVESGFVNIKLAIISSDVNTDTAIQYFEIALKIFKQHRALQPGGISHTATCDDISFALAYLFESQGDYKMACSYYNEYLYSIIEHERQFEDQHEQYLRELRWEQKHARRHYSWLGQRTCLQETGFRHKEDIDYVLSIPQVNLLQKWNVQRAHAHKALARVFLHDRNFDTVMRHLHEAHTLYTENLGSDSLFVAKVHDLYAKVFSIQDKPGDAITSLKESLFIKLHGNNRWTEALTPLMLHFSDNIGNKRDTLETLIELANVCEGCGEDKEALLAYENALDLVDTNDNISIMLQNAVNRTRRILLRYV